MRSCLAINGYVKIGDIISSEGYIDSNGEFVYHPYSECKVIDFGEYEGRAKIIYKRVSQNEDGTYSDHPHSKGTHWDWVDQAPRIIKILESKESFPQRIVNTIVNKLIEMKRTRLS